MAILRASRVRPTFEDDNKQLLSRRGDPSHDHHHGRPREGTSDRRSAQWRSRCPPMDPPAAARPDRVAHLSQGVSTQAPQRPDARLGTLRQLGGVGSSPRGGASRSTTSSMAGTQGRASRSPLDSRRPGTSATAWSGRGRRRGRGAHERALARGARRTGHRRTVPIVLKNNQMSIGPSSGALEVILKSSFPWPGSSRSTATTSWWSGSRSSGERPSSSPPGAQVVVSFA